jgi:hypothetical protein
MQSTLTPQETDPHDAFLIQPDVVLAARADQALPDPVHDALSRLAHRAAHTTPEVSAGTPAAPIPTVDTTFRAAAVGPATKLPGERSAFAKWARTTSIAFLFALCSAIAAQTWRHHSDVIKQMIASRMPPFVLALTSLSPPAETPAPAEQQPDAAPVQAATADQATPAQPAQPPDTAAPAPAAAAAAAESTPSVQSPSVQSPSVQSPSVQSPSVQSMARDLATMGQQIELLKASIEQLKAGQAQISRDVAKASEQNLRPRVATLPPRPVAAPPVRKPKPAFPPAQAAAASPLPPPPSAAPPALSEPQPQATVESDGGPVVRPPMPLR